MKRLLITGIAIAVASVPASLRASSAIAFSSNGIWAYAVDRAFSQKEAMDKAMEACRKKGGIDPKIIAASSTTGCSSIAVSGKGKDTIIGFALGLQSTWQAQVAAMRDCKQKGGLQARSVATFQEKTADNLSSSGL